MGIAALQPGIQAAGLGGLGAEARRWRQVGRIRTTALATGKPACRLLTGALVAGEPARLAPAAGNGQRHRRRQRQASHRTGPPLTHRDECREADPRCLRHALHQAALPGGSLCARRQGSTGLQESTGLYWRSETECHEHVESHRSRRRSASTESHANDPCACIGPRPNNGQHSGTRAHRHQLRTRRRCGTGNDWPGAPVLPNEITPSTTASNTDAEPRPDNPAAPGHDGPRPHGPAQEPETGRSGPPSGDSDPPPQKVRPPGDRLARRSATSPAL